MALKRWDGAAAVDIAAISRWDGAAMVPLTVLKRWDGAAFVDITLPGGGGGLSATGAPNPAETETIFDDGALATDVESYAVTITPLGGTGPYTYSWAFVSGSSSVSCSSPTAATTTFRATLYRLATKSAVWRCTVTDSLAATTTVDITVNLTR